MEGLSHYLHIRTPVRFFIEVVGHELSVQYAQRCCIQRVLRDWHQDPGLWGGADDVHERVDTGTGAGREVDASRVGRVSISALDEVCYALSNARGPLRLRIRPDTLDVVEQLPRPFNHVRLVAQTVEQHVFVVKEERVLQQTRHLPEEGDGLLVQLLRVA